MRKSAFSLVELTVVLAIAGIAAGAVALRLARPLGIARMADALSSIRDFDLSTRSAARSQDRPLRMVADLDGGRLICTDERGGPSGGPTLALSPGSRIERFLVGGQDRYGGEAAVLYSRQGLTPTYAYCLQSQGRRQWVAVAGLSGQQVLVENEQEAREILAEGAGRIAR